jgi:hypothetical protein
LVALVDTAEAFTGFYVDDKRRLARLLADTDAGVFVELKVPVTVQLALALAPSLVEDKRLLTGSRADAFAGRWVDFFAFGTGDVGWAVAEAGLRIEHRIARTIVVLADTSAFPGVELLIVAGALVRVAEGAVADAGIGIGGVVRRTLVRTET